MRPQNFSQKSQNTKKSKIFGAPKTNSFHGFGSRKSENNEDFLGKESLIFLRYLILILLAFPNLWIFYFIFTPLTVYPVYFLLSLFFKVSLQGITLTINNSAVELIKPCIAGSAYYLLLILNLSTPMKLKTRVFSILSSFLIFLAVNILRIFFFSVLFLNSFSFFNFFHLVFWYVLSSLIVFLIWILNIKIFKIKQIPVYSDFKSILRSRRKIKKSK